VLLQLEKSFFTQWKMLPGVDVGKKATSITFPTGGKKQISEVREYSPPYPLRLFFLPL